MMYTNREQLKNEIEHININIYWEDMGMFRKYLLGQKIGAIRQVLYYSSFMVGTFPVNKGSYEDYRRYLVLEEIKQGTILISDEEYIDYIVRWREDILDILNTEIQILKATLNL